MLEDFGLQFHHMGLAVKEPSLALKFFGGLGYQSEPAVFDSLQNVDLIICSHDVMPDVEIISPSSILDNGEGPIDSLLKRRPEGIIYHICYTTADLDDSLKRMKGAGLQIFTIQPPKPAVLFSGKPVSFYMIGGVGLIEILETN